MKRFLKNIKAVHLALLLAGLLVLLAALGSFIPQNRPLEIYWNLYGGLWATAVTALGLDSLYSSWPFRLILILLALDVLYCLAKTFQSMKARGKALVFQPGRRENLSARQDFTLENPEAGWANALSVFKARGACQSRELDGEKVVWKRRGRLKPYSLLAVHAAVWLFLAAALIFSFFGVSGVLVLLEGQTATLETANESGPRQARLTLDKFTITPAPQSALEEYRSYLSVEKTGTPKFQHVLEVNNPLRLGGLSVYQEGFGKTDDGRAASIILVRSDQESPLVWLAAVLMIAGLCLYYLDRDAAVVLWLSAESRTARLAVEARDRKFALALLRKWRGLLSALDKESKPL